MAKRTGKTKAILKKLLKRFGDAKEVHVHTDHDKGMRRIEVTHESGYKTATWTLASGTPVDEADSFTPPPSGRMGRCS